ncbi:TolC family protein [Sinomicrobium weinanense]|uniref:TolC family protein n=1 Tax=Sinomicrobium weinanense TaxID=2842200 RepID=A0A926JPK5_9FLAO|nr:TolC family protein [Sinomicrobium weinanense]MBC9794973.1 TolC family protein [Sinomicrobium weinanense]MBU3125166.1 TolC family protein [Sinomicrobium weinanense]
MRYYIPLVVILWCTSWKTQAQERDMISLTALYNAAMQYPDIKAREAAIAETNVQYNLIQLANLPRIDIQAQNTFGSAQRTGGAFFPLPGIFNISGTGTEAYATATNMVASGTVQWNAIQFGKHRNRVKASRIRKEQAITSMDLEKLSLKRKISRAYIDWLYYHNMKNWAAREIGRFSQLMDISRSLVRSGIAAAGDSLMVKASLQQAEALKESWKGRIASTSNTLTRFTGIPLQSVQQTTSRFFTTIGENMWMDPIPENHPVVQLQQQEIAFTKKQKQIAGKNILPDISLLAGGQLRGVSFSDTAGGSWEDSYNMPVQNYLVGVGMTWNLNSVYTAPLEVRRYEEQINRYKAEEESINLGILEDHESAQQQLIHTAKQIREAEQAYAAAKKAYQLYEVRYRNGIIDLTDLLQIQQTLQFTDKERITAYYQYWQYVIRLAGARADFSLLTRTFN